jgi:Trypsin-like peptidase domain
MRILVSLLLATLLTFSSCAAAAIPGVLHISDAVGNGFCTAFSVNDKQRLYVTAAHCVDESDTDLPAPHLFGHKVTVKKFDKMLDLAIIQAVLGQTQLPVAKLPPNPGEYTSIYGYVRDHEFPTIYEGTFKQYALYFNRDLHHLMLIALFDMKIAEGQSGSPVMNQAGEVVSVAQLWFYNEHLGGGPPWVVFYEFVKDYLPTK